MRQLSYIKPFLLSVAVMFGALTLSPLLASADTTTPVSSLPLSITPLCANSTTNTAYWNVTNSNSTNIDFSWKNIDDGSTGTLTAVSGTSQLATEYQANQNNTTHFTYPGFDGQTNSSNTPCGPVAPVTPPTVTCIDGTNAQNISFTYVNKGDVQVHTVGNQPLCTDIHLYFSSYIMPANYDGNGFYGNPTAYPQPEFGSDNVVLAAGTDGTAELNIDMPSNCKNVQTDLYYAPEITTVGPNGHGTQNIDSHVYMANLSDTSCNPTTPGGMGGGTNTTTTPSTPVVTPPAVTPVSAPTPGGLGGGSSTPVATAHVVTAPTVPTAPQLANTGQSTLVSSLIAGVLAFSAVLVYGTSGKRASRLS